MTKTMTVRVAVLLLCLAASAALVARADRIEDAPDSPPLSGLPMQIGEWRGVQLPPFTKSVLDVLGLSDYLTRAYVTPARAELGLYIGYWRSQRQGETIHSPLNCLPGSGWEPVSRSLVTLPDPREPGRTMPVNRYVVQRGGERQLVFYWFQSHGRIVASEYWSKAYLVMDAVRLNRTDGSIVRIIAPVAGEGANAEERAEAGARQFIAELLPRLNGYLPS